jgi:hypothetical protein
LESSLPPGDNAGDQPAQEGLATCGRADLELGVFAVRGRRELEERAARALRVDEGSDGRMRATETQQRPALVDFEAYQGLLTEPRA